MTRSIDYYSVNPKDEPILDQIAAHLERLSCEQQAALAIAALYEGYEPDPIEFGYGSCLPYRFEECVALLQHLSLSGKLALVRAITEHLMVVELEGQGGSWLYDSSDNKLNHPRHDRQHDRSYHCRQEPSNLKAWSERCHENQRNAIDH